MSEPKVIIVGAPGMPKGDCRVRCQECGQSYSIQLSTAATIARLKGVGRALPVICWSCGLKTGILTPNTTMVGNEQARQALGLDG